VLRWLRQQFKTFLCCGFRRTDKAMGQAYQCWWRICREINAFPALNTTDDGEAVNLYAPGGRPLFTPRKIPGTHFCSRLSRPQAILHLEGLGQLKKSNDLMGNKTCDLLAWSTVPQPTTLPRDPYTNIKKRINFESCGSCFQCPWQAFKGHVEPYRDRRY
jgi:hypothetical protein